METSSDNAAGGRKSLIDTIINPLGFYVLSLLVIEVYLGVVVVRTGADGSSPFDLAHLGVYIFIGVLTIVTLLAVCYPAALYYGKDEISRREFERFKRERKEYEMFDSDMRDAELLANADRFEAAISVYQSLHRMRNESAQVLTDLGKGYYMLYVKSGEKNVPETTRDYYLDEARKAFEEAIQIAEKKNAQYFRPIYNLACIHARKLDFAKCREYLAKAAAINQQLAILLVGDDVDFKKLTDEQQVALKAMLGIPA